MLGCECLTYTPGIIYIINIVKSYCSRHCPNPVEVDRREGIARESIAISNGAMLLKIEDIMSSWLQQLFLNGVCLFRLRNAK